MALPGHVRGLEVLDYTIRLQRRVGLLVGSVALLALGWQQWQIASLSTELRNQDFIVVPGAADFVRVRPNLVGDRTVLAFGTYFAERMISVGYRDLEDRYESMAEHMSPTLWAKLRLELEDTLALFRSVRATEIFDVEHIDAERLQLPDGSNGFEAVLKGKVSRFAGERKLEERSEVVTVTYRTSPLSQDDPWLFEVTDFRRWSQEEYRRYELGKRGGK